MTLPLPQSDDLSAPESALEAGSESAHAAGAPPAGATAVGVSPVARSTPAPAFSATMAPERPLPAYVDPVDLPADDRSVRTGGSGSGPGGPRSGPPRRRPPGPRPNYALRRVLVLAILVIAAMLLWFVVKGIAGLIGGLFGGTDAKPKASTSAPVEAPASAPALAGPESPAPKPSPEQPQGAAGASDATSMVRTMRMASQTMSPKSIVAGPTGLLFAQNMMYHHSVSVFGADGALLRTIPDSVKLSDFGVSGHPGMSKGAPVEMAFTPDGKQAWVSNYSMYGKGFGPEGLDSCSAGDGTDTSYAYRIDTATLAVNAVVPVGAVPKFVAVTPDASKVLVTNWCSWNLSVIDAKSAKEVARIDLGGKYPRGIAISPDSTTAYVALMGSQRIVAVDLATKAVSTFAEPGNGPRHLVISPDGKFLYVTNNSSGTVVKIDRADGSVVDTVQTASEPRSMAISADGKAVYVVNYGASTMSKIRTSDLKVLQTVKTDASPIGITYEPTKKQIWVACYGGSLIVFDDSKLAG